MVGVLADLLAVFFLFFLSLTSNSQVHNKTQTTALQCVKDFRDFRDRAGVELTIFRFIRIQRQIAAHSCCVCCCISTISVYDADIIIESAAAKKVIFNVFIESAASYLFSMSLLNLPLVIFNVFIESAASYFHCLY
jgi:hypothetical protein